MTSRERVLAAINHKEPDRVPIDLGSYPGATSMNVRAYQDFLKYLGIDKKVRVAHQLMFTAEIDDDILDMFNIDTISIKPSISLNEFNAPETFIDLNWDIEWRRSSNFTYGPIKGPFRQLVNPSLSDLRKYKWPSPSEIENLSEWKARAQKIRQKTDRALVGTSRFGHNSRFW